MSTPKVSKITQGQLLNQHKALQDKQAAIDKSLPGTWTPDDYSLFLALTEELLRRQKDTLAIYQPLPVAMQFHLNMKHETALSGGNRAGKTASASAEVAMAARACHYVKDKYPTHEVRIACIGNDDKHLSLMYEYLFEKSQFKIFKHPVEKKWMMVSEDEHAEYKHLWEDAPPFIPPSMVEFVAWKKKKENMPKRVKLKNGTILFFYGGLVKKLPQGRNFHLVWLDEEIEHAEKWLVEMRARISAVNGKLFWSATPQMATVEFISMEEAAMNPDNEGKPLSQQTGYFNMLPCDNKYISKVGREAFEEKLKGNEQEYETRIRGKSARKYRTIYPMFSREKHVITNFEMRWDDTRRLIFDPGVDVAAVLYVVTPKIILDPDEIAKMSEQEKKYRTRPSLVAIDECHILHSDPQLMAQRVKQMLWRWPFQDIWDLTIDEKGGFGVVWKGMGPDENAAGLYMKALKDVDIKLHEKEWQFGASDKKYGVETTYTYLNPQRDGLPKLFVNSICKRLTHEFMYWMKKTNPKGDLVGYEDGCDLLDCTRYGTTRDLSWMPPYEPTDPQAFSFEDHYKRMQGVMDGTRYFGG